MAMLLDQGCALIKYLSNCGIDLVITDCDAYSCLNIELLYIYLCLGTILADNLSNVLNTLFKLKGSHDFLRKDLVNKELSMMESCLGHFGSDSIQQVADVLVCILDAGDGYYL